MKWRSLEESALQTETRSLHQIYAERKALISKYVPADIQAVHARVVAELKQSKIADQALGVGADLPRFDLPGQNGKIVRSTDLAQTGPLSSYLFAGAGAHFAWDS
jgi:hypothetical protein